MRSLRIGLTGGIGTGKSAALAAFRRLGAATVCADEIVHEMSRRGRPMHRAIVRAFGPRYLTASGELDRKALAGDVFARPALRRRLERATHPLVLAEMRRRMGRARRRVVVADVPLLFEAGAEGLFDATVVVAAPRALALRRLMRRDRVSRAEGLARMRAQLPIERKRDLADVVIDNRGPLAGLQQEVGRWFAAFDLIAAARR